MTRRPLPDPVRDFGTAMRPAYDLLLGDSVRTGRLTTVGLPLASRQLAVAGLIAVMALVASLVFGDLWRRGDLLSINSRNFLPSALFPVTLLAMCLGWVLLLVGAALASARAQVAAAVLFLLVNASFADPLVQTLLSPAGIEVGRHVVRTGYYVAPALLLLLALTWRWPRGQRLVRPVAVTGIVLACLALFGGLLWMQSTAIGLGQPADLPLQVAIAVQTMTDFTLPLVFLSQLAIIDFTYSVSAAVIRPLALVPLLALRIAFVVVIAAKLLWQLPTESGADLTDRPLTVLRTVSALLVFAGFAYLVRRLYRPGEEPPSEGILFGAALGLALPFVGAAFPLLLATPAAQYFGVDFAQRMVDGFPIDPIATYGKLAVAGLALAGALILVGYGRRRRRSTRLLAGVTFIAAWATATALIAIVMTDPGVRFTLLDVLVTMGAAAYAVLRWRQLDGLGLTRLIVLVAFVYLVTSRGAVFAQIADWIGVPPVALVAFGVIVTLLTGSAFAATGSLHFPQQARVLLWIGGLIVNLALLNWLQTARDLDVGAEAGLLAFAYVGLPLAIWLLAARRFHPPEIPPEPEDESEPEPEPEPDREAESEPRLSLVKGR